MLNLKNIYTKIKNLITGGFFAHDPFLSNHDSSTRDRSALFWRPCLLLTITAYSVLTRTPNLKPPRGAHISSPAHMDYIAKLHPFAFFRKGKSLDFFF